MNLFRIRTHYLATQDHCQGQVLLRAMGAITHDGKVMRHKSIITGSTFPLQASEASWQSLQLADRPKTLWSPQDWAKALVKQGDSNYGINATMGIERERETHIWYLDCFPVSTMDNTQNVSKTIFFMQLHTFCFSLTSPSGQNIFVIFSQHFFFIFLSIYVLRRLHGSDWWMFSVSQIKASVSGWSPSITASSLANVPQVLWWTVWVFVCHHCESALQSTWSKYPGLPCNSFLSLAGLQCYRIPLNCSVNTVVVKVIYVEQQVNHYHSTTAMIECELFHRLL